MTPEFNTVAIVLLVALFLLWNLDFIATLLNLGSLKPELPEEFRSVYDEEKYAQSQDYTRAKSRFGIITSIASLTVLLVFWFVGGFSWLDSWTRSLEWGPIPTGLLFVCTLMFGSYLAGLPGEIYFTFKLEEQFGFNKTTPKTFLTDQIRNIGIFLVIGLPLLAAIFAIFLTFENAWIYGWLLTVAWSLIAQYLAPTYILPLYNKFEPMAEGELKDAIHAMAQRCDFPLTELKIVDGSRRSGKTNAYFTGFGKSKKIALFDTLVEKHTTEELVAVLAHEIGHFKRKHIIQRMALGIVQTGLIFFLLGLVLNPTSPFSRELFDAFGIEIISPHAGLVLFMILFNPISRLISIPMHAWSRKHEFEADAYAAEATGKPEIMIEALKKVSKDNLDNLTPHQLRVVLDYSHPPMLVRIQALRALPPAPSA
ncbi:MAG: M48 family metallopeptidase [Akkermansiaceae bacterium]